MSRSFSKLEAPILKYRGSSQSSPAVSFTSTRYRIGASSLLNDLLMQRARMETGRYYGPDYMTVD